MTKNIMFCRPDFFLLVLFCCSINVIFGQFINIFCSFVVFSVCLLFIQVPESVHQPGFEVTQCDMKRSSECDVRPNVEADGDGFVREIHSCPNSPTETDCSSGFSTLRRRSVTLTEKVRGKKRLLTFAWLKEVKQNRWQGGAG